MEGYLVAVTLGRNAGSRSEGASPVSANAPRVPGQILRGIGEKQDWSGLGVGSAVEVREHRMPPHIAFVDQKTSDSEVLWVIGPLGQRRAFHNSDGVTIVAIDGLGTGTGEAGPLDPTR